MSYYGLGYNHSFSVSEPEQLNQEKRHDNVSDVDALMTTYMQQCVDYHEEQKKIEAREQEKQAQNEDIPQVVTISYKKIKLSEPVNFVAGDIQKGNITKCSEYISNGDCKSIEVAQQESCSNEQSMVDPAFVKALHTAQEIARSFNKTATLHQDYENAKLQYPFAEKRNEFMTGHKKMLHNRFIQNLDYLAKQDEEKLKEQMSQLKSIQEIQAKRQQILLEQKQKRILLNQQRLQSKGSQCVAGVGSKQRKGHEKKLEKSGHMTKSSLSSTAASCAVYISGLPTNFDADPSNSNPSTQISSEEALESILHGLFSSFGKISSLKLYREMPSRKMKGDGLISYEFSSIRKDLFSKGESYDDIQGFLKSVCSQLSIKHVGLYGYFFSSANNILMQLSGLELPDGSTVKAEPADMDYKYKKNKKNENIEIDSKTPTNLDVSSTLLLKPKAAEENNGDDGCDDGDLDDFFASL